MVLCSCSFGHELKFDCVSHCGRDLIGREDQPSFASDCYDVVGLRDGKSGESSESEEGRGKHGVSSLNRKMRDWKVDRMWKWKS